MHRKRYRLWFVGLLTLVLLGLLGWAFAPHRRSSDDVGRVQVGMTQAEVEAALGQPADWHGTKSQLFAAPPGSADTIGASGESIQATVWECAGGWIVVFFSDGRVVSANVANRVPSQTRLRRWLGW